MELGLGFRHCKKTPHTHKKKEMAKVMMNVKNRFCTVSWSILSYA